MNGNKLSIFLATAALTLSAIVVYDLIDSPSAPLTPDVVDRRPQSFDYHRLEPMDVAEHETSNDAREATLDPTTPSVDQMGPPPTTPDDVPEADLPTRTVEPAAAGLADATFRRIVKDWRAPELCAKSVRSTKRSTLRVLLEIDPEGAVTDVEPQDAVGPMEVALADCLQRHRTALSFPPNPARDPLKREATFVF